MKKLHVGCGKNLIKGWINADMSKHADMKIDAREKLPFEDKSIDFIYSEHFIEHITKPEALSFLKECKRILKTAIRISTPNLEFLIKCYLDDNLTEWQNMKWVPTSKCDLVNEGMRNGPHIYVYDNEELINLLKEAGFSYVRKCEYKKSDFEELKKLESRYYHNEVILEAYINKPPNYKEIEENSCDIKNNINIDEKLISNPYINGEIITEITNKILPMVSVCVMTHNHVQWIDECLDGIIKQKTNFNFEIIIHDDGSNDGTREKILKFQKNNSGLVKLILQKENIFTKCDGIYPTTILALNAKGKYIAWCDGDDYWMDKHKLQKQVDFLESNIEYSGTYTPWNNFNQKKNKFSKIMNETKLKDFSSEELLAYNFTGSNICFSSLLHRNDFTKEEYEILWGDYAVVTMTGLHGGCKLVKDIEPTVFRIKHGHNTWQDQDKSVMYRKIIELHNRVYHYGIVSNNKKLIGIQNVYRERNNMTIKEKELVFGIIVPIYKRPDGKSPEYLKRCIDSVMNQTHKNFKLYVIGDKYEDDKEITDVIPSEVFYENLPEAKERDNYRGNRLWCCGGTFATNFGIDKALIDEIDYIILLDYDEYWSNDHLEVLKNNYPFVWACTSSTIHKNNKGMDYLPNIETDENYVNFIPVPKGVVKSSFCWNYKKMPLKMINVFEETGIDEPGDANLLKRMSEYVTKNNLRSIYIDKLTCYKEEQGYSKTI